MKGQILLIGFSCTGKTYLSRKALEGKSIDSDILVRERVGKKLGRQFDHIYKFYIEIGRVKANQEIEQAETSIIADLIEDSNYKIISLGPGFPLRPNWPILRDKSSVILFKRSAKGIYDGFIKRRSKIFQACSKARESDNWDVRIIVDENRKEYPREQAIKNIKRTIKERERGYNDNDFIIDTDDQEAAIEKLREFYRKNDC